MGVKKNKSDFTHFYGTAAEGEKKNIVCLLFAVAHVYVLE